VLSGADLLGDGGARWSTHYLDAESEHRRKGGSGNMDLDRFIREEEGQGLVEYALIIAVIAIAVIVAMVFLRGQIENIFSNIGNNLT
jgi:pilus assembly protein Flp/PilA